MTNTSNFGRQPLVLGALAGGMLYGIGEGALAAQYPEPAGETLLFEDYQLRLPLGLNKEGFLVPADNPMSREKIELGQALFFDARLSIDNTVSCATCHDPQHAFAGSGPISRETGASVAPRNVPPIINRAYTQAQFWDGRAPSLEAQAKAPLVNPNEMGMPSHAFVVERIGAIPGYSEWFSKVFGREVNIDDLARAIAAFERTLLSGGSRFDRFMAGEADALSESEQRGFELFRGKARCTQCHSGPNFTDEVYHNLGVGWDRALVDLGRYGATRDRDDIGAFKTPTLRELTHTAPYMHNGAFATLEETVEFYDKGGIQNPFLDVEMKRSRRSMEQNLEYFERRREAGDQRPVDEQPAGLNLTKQERDDLVAFLKSLSGWGWQQHRPPSVLPQ